jgi:ribosomal protein S24E
MVHLTQTVHLSSVKINTISKRTEVSHEPCHLGVPSDVSKMISKPMVHLVQSMHLSCTNTNTIFKRKEVRFHMTHVT